MAGADALAQDDSEALHARSAKLIELYDRAHAWVSEVPGKAGLKPSAGTLAASALSVNALGNMVFQSKPATVFGKGTTVLLAVVLRARLGRFAEFIRLETNGGRPLTAYAQKKIDRGIASRFDAFLQRSGKGAGLDVVIGGMLITLEAWNVSNKLEKAEKSSKHYGELAMALVGLGAAFMELGAIGAEIVAGSKVNSVANAAKVVSGGLRLVGGALAGALGVVGAWENSAVAGQHAKSKRFSLAVIYGARASLQLGAAGFSFAIGLAYSGPLIEHIVKRVSGPWWLLNQLGRALAMSGRLAG